MFFIAHMTWRTPPTSIAPFHKTGIISSHWFLGKRLRHLPKQMLQGPFHSDIMWRHSHVGSGSFYIRNPFLSGHLGRHTHLGVKLSDYKESLLLPCVSFWVQPKLFGGLGIIWSQKKHLKICWAKPGHSFHRRLPSVICFKGSGIPSTSSTTTSSSSIDTQVLGAAGAYDFYWWQVMGDEWCCDVGFES